MFELNTKKIILVTIAVVLLLMALLISKLFSPPLNSLYPFFSYYGVQLFGTREALWVFVGIAIALGGVVLNIEYQEKIQLKRVRSIVKSFKEEILSNVERLFTGEVERPLSRIIFELINRDFFEYIKNIKKYRDLVVLYDSLYYYQEVVTRWYPSDQDVVTEKHADTCNTFVKYFEGKGLKVLEGLNPERRNKLMNESIRNTAISTKKENIKKWELKLNQDIKDIYKL